MITRIHLEDAEAADDLATAIDAAGHEVAVVQERFAGEDDGEAVEYVVCTPAPPEQLAGLVPAGAFVTHD